MRTPVHAAVTAKVSSFSPAPRAPGQGWSAFENRPDTSLARQATGWGHNFLQVRVHHSVPAAIQPELTVNEPGDKYEQEADRVADEVMRVLMPTKPADVGERAFGSAVQRKCAKCEEEELRRQPLHGKKERLLQTKPASPGRAGGDRRPQTYVPLVVHEVLRSPGQPLDLATRASMQFRFGYDFSQVRIHTDAKAAESAFAVNARAYTLGRNVVFGARQYAPGTYAGQRLIAHELTHVVQQRRNSQPPTRTSGIGQAHGAFEAEAARSADSLSAHFAGYPGVTQAPQAGTLQRGPGAVAVLAGAGALAFLAGFGIAFGIDYLSMDRERAEEFGRSLGSGWRSSLPNCPCSPPTDDTTNWESDANPNLNDYHPGADSSYRSTAAATPGSRHGQQCTYKDDNLMTSGDGAGTPDYYAPRGIDIPYHIVYDVKTWDELGWSTYNQFWVPNNGNGCS